MDHHQDRGVLDERPDLVEQRVVRIVVAHLDVGSEHLGSGRDGVGGSSRPLPGSGSGRGGQAVGRLVAKLTAHWLSQAAIGLVRVDEQLNRRAERPQGRDPLRLVGPVVDRPFAADQRMCRSTATPCP